MIRLTDEQWERIRKHFPEEHIPDGRPGRKPIPTRRVLEAVLWILNTGAQWHMLPQSFPNYKTVCKKCGSTKETQAQAHSMIRNLPEEMVLDRRPVPLSLLHLLRSGIDVVDGARSRRRIAVR